MMMLLYARSKVAPPPLLDITAALIVHYGTEIIFRLFMQSSRVYARDRTKGHGITQDNLCAHHHLQGPSPSARFGMTPAAHHDAFRRLFRIIPSASEGPHNRKLRHTNFCDYS